MRWQNLSVEAEESRTLAGYKEPAKVRTFDAPEALDIRFYEVRAKSALNKVPKQSQVPFPWTVNPYRGCTHACVYCLLGETPVLMADGRTKPIADLAAGDKIYGTVRQGSYRRYVTTEVLDHWRTVRPAYRTTLDDGTELVTSGDHRFLSNRGWKYVTGAEQGRNRRPHLTENNELLGTGQFAAPPAHSDDYRRGYVCGLVRGDGHIGSYSYVRAGRTRDDHHRFRLALTDLEALHRSREYLRGLGVATDEFEYLKASFGWRPMRAIRTSARAKVDQMREIVRWPWSPTDDWAKGFLAGIFDAEGSCSCGVLMIPNTDAAIIEQISSCMTRFRFDYAIEDRGLANGIQNVRLVGGLAERLRFFHTVDPAITRKRSIDGMALKTLRRRRVVSVEALDAELPLYDITTGTGDFIANGVVSHNCFARPTHNYLDLNAREDFEREIVVKVNVPEVLRADLARPSWKHEHVALGTNTDPYQWVESKYRLMPGIWEALRDSRTPCSILTKSPLLLRDRDLMVQIAERVPFSASVSVPSLDEKAWRDMEPHTPHPRARLEAVAELSRLGISTGVLIAPLVPGVNDAPEQVEPILELASEAGADNIVPIGLHLRGEVKDIWFDWLRDKRPDLIPRYEKLYPRGAYLPHEEKERLAKVARYRGPKRRARPLGDRPRFERREDPPPPPEPAQARLF